MLHWNELRYSQDNKNLIIDVAVDPQDYFKDVSLDTIVIDNQDTYVANGPSSNPIYTYTVSSTYDKTYSLPEEGNCNPVLVDEDKSYCLTNAAESDKRVILEIPLNTIGVDPCKDILFVYAIATGTPSINTPCGMDNLKIMGTVINLQGIYNGMMSYIREIEKECIAPKGFIDAILKFKALEMAVRTGNYPLVIKYWNKFYSGKGTVSVTNCGCYG